MRASEEGDSAVAHAHKEKLRKYEARLPPGDTASFEKMIIFVE